jgi:hypothetical protein
MKGLKMFKNKSVVDDLISSMEKNLVKNAVEDTFGFDKIAKAVDYLNSAADLFDDVGLSAEAETITRVLESLAEKKKNSKKSKDSKDKEEKDSKKSKDSKKKETKKTTKKASDPYTDGITSEQMLKNLETSGTVFDYANSDTSGAEDCAECMDDNLEVNDSDDLENEDIE